MSWLNELALWPSSAASNRIESRRDETRGNETKRLHWIGLNGFKVLADVNSTSCDRLASLKPSRTEPSRTDSKRTNELAKLVHSRLGTSASDARKLMPPAASLDGVAFSPGDGVGRERLCGSLGRVGVIGRRPKTQTHSNTDYIWRVT